MVNPEALLGLIADLYSQVVALQAELSKEREKSGSSQPNGKRDAEKAGVS